MEQSVCITSLYSYYTCHLCGEQFPTQDAFTTHFTNKPFSVAYAQ
jgi:hypothetical protein